MKLILISGLLVFLFLPITSLQGQDVGGKTLISQSRTTSVNIGKCDITIKYHSPVVGGRKIFGGIVPFDFVVDDVEYPWRAGANQRTTIDFSQDVTIEGKPLKAGSYGFLVLVNKDKWVLIFSSGKSWGAFNYDKSNDVLRIPVKTMKMPFQEWLSYDFIEPTSETIQIQLRWEETAVRFEIATDALVNTLNDLNQNENKSTNDYQDLAFWTLEKDPLLKEQALEYLETSYSLLDSIKDDYLRKAYLFNYKIMKGELLNAMGKEKKGYALLEEAWATASGFDIYYYALRKYTVEDQQEEALRILNEGIKRFPDNFQTHFAFGEYYLKEKNQQKATEHFKKAYDMTVQQESRWVNYAQYLYLQNKLALAANNN